MDDLDNALALYRKAQTYAPDNDKLRDRWILFVIRVFLHQLAANR